MIERRVYRAENIQAAREAVAVLREQGLGEEAVSLVARSDIELEAISDRHHEADVDFVDAASRGAGVGAVTGLLAGLAATAFPPLGITLAGAAVLGAVGAAVGSWASALTGETLPESVRRQFDEEIRSGRILLLVDAPAEDRARLRALLESAGLRALDHAAPSAAI